VDGVPGLFGLVFGVAVPGFGVAVLGFGVAVPGFGVAVPGVGVAILPLGVVVPGFVLFPVGEEEPGVEPGV
jgi:hypothetical protein